MKADVAGADDVEVRSGQERIDVDVHPAAADQAVLLREVVVQLVVDDCERPSSRAEPRLADRVVLVAAAADRADGTAVREDEHLRAGALRRRPLGADDRHERGRFAALQCVGRRRQDVFVQKRTSIFDLFLMLATNACC